MLQSLETELGTEYFELFEINETKLGKKWKKKFNFSTYKSFIAAWWTWAIINFIRIDFTNSQTN